MIRLTYFVESEFAIREYYYSHFERHNDLSMNHRDFVGQESVSWSSSSCCKFRV